MQYIALVAIIVISFALLVVPMKSTVLPVSPVEQPSVAAIATIPVPEMAKVLPSTYEG